MHRSFLSLTVTAALIMSAGISRAMAGNCFPKAMITFRFDDANTTQLGLIELINREKCLSRFSPLRASPARSPI